MSGAVVFGGAGFIGSHLLGSLAVQGHAPLVSADIQEPARRIDGVRYVRCDVRRPVDLESEGIELVYNLAGLVATPGHPPVDYLRTNVAGAVNVTQWAGERGIDMMVFTSTMSVYPLGETLKTESSPTEPVNAYGESKLLAEGIHRQWRLGGTDRRLVVARPAVIFGPGDRGNFWRLQRLIKRGRFVYPGRRDTIKAFGYVEDLVASFGFALGLGDAEIVYNFAYEERLTIEEICGLISRELEVRPPKVSLPMPAMRVGALPFEGLEKVGVRTGINRTRLSKLVQSTNIFPGRLLDEGFRFPTTPPSAMAAWLAAEARN